uniref:Uncharacterized protein n=1 Tax=Aegilops tauschii subsp. strangulata TaxID=200361 RepID=A0A453MUI9_AEGTS
MLVYYYVWLIFGLAYRRKCWQIERRLRIRELRGENLHKLIGESDAACISQSEEEYRGARAVCSVPPDERGKSGDRGCGS